VRVGQKTNLPEEEKKHPAEVRKGTKAENRVGAAGHPPKVRQVVDLGADFLVPVPRAAFKTELPDLTGGGADQTELQLKGNAASSW
jgi:hypothetical protein